MLPFTPLKLTQAVDQKMVELKDLSDAVVEFGRDLCVADVPLGEYLRSRMRALSGYVRSKLQGRPSWGETSVGRSCLPL